jgi:hypothetical protein
VVESAYSYDIALRNKHWFHEAENRTAGRDADPVEAAALKRTITPAEKQLLKVAALKRRTSQARHRHAVQRVCPAGKFKSGVSSSAWAEMGIGFGHDQNFGRCIACTAGQYQAQSGKQSQCVACPLGQYASKTSQTACWVCDAADCAANTGLGPGQRAPAQATMAPYLQGIIVEPVTQGPRKVPDNDDDDFTTNVAATTASPRTIVWPGSPGRRRRAAALKPPDTSTSRAVGTVEQGLRPDGEIQSRTGLNPAKFRRQAAVPLSAAELPLPPSWEQNLLLKPVAPIPLYEEHLLATAQPTPVATMAPHKEAHLFDCPPGKYEVADKSKVSLKQCLECRVGKYQRYAAASSCAMCTRGQFQPLSGQRACRKCNDPFCNGLADLWCAVGTFRRFVSCSACPVGKYQGTLGQTSCAACPHGKYQLSEAQPHCDDQKLRRCASGNWRNVFKCHACPAGKFQPLAGQSIEPYSSAASSLTRVRV